ncbi:MAG: MFS transporter, partial [Kiritimatiellae bacterium]|nr:MFS transporter [Kiritimatiellia bacterium]
MPSLYNKYLLFIAGLGGLLYGIDVGVIAGALPYLQATTNYTAGELSSVVAAVLLGSVLSSLFAGSLAEWMGRKNLMIVSGICFVLSVPVICIPTGITWLLLGRILQGVAGGLIGVVVPLYLAECLPSDK